MSSGGKREGAGRKTAPEGNRVKLSVRVLPSTKAKLIELSEGAIGRYLDKMVSEK
jgi:hypothetical protein